MTFAEYIEQLKGRVEDFEKTYGDYMHDDPLIWPDEYPSSADWDEQFELSALNIPEGE